MCAINDPPGQTQSPASSDHFSHFKFLLVFEIFKSGDGQKDRQHVQKQLSLLAVTVDRPRGSIYCIFINIKNYLSEQHERVVRRKISLEKIHAMFLQCRNGVLLGRVQRCHDSLRANLNLVRVEELEQHQKGRRFDIGQVDLVIAIGQAGIEHGIKDCRADRKYKPVSRYSLL